TREAFGDVARRLGPGGVASQWVHAYRLPVADFMTVLRTFFDAFPYGSVWEVYPGADYLLLGWNDPLRPSFKGIDERMAEGGVKEQMVESRIRNLEELLGSLVTDADGARRMAGAGPILTDDHCAIEYTAVWGLFGDTNAELLSKLDGARAAACERTLYADV